MAFFARSIAVSPSRAYPLLAGLTLLFLLAGAGDIAQATGEEKSPRAPSAESSNDPLPEGAVARFGTLRLRQIGGAPCTAFSSDGAALASADAAGIHVWDVATGREIRHFPNASEVLAVSFSATGTSVVAATKDCTLQYWEILSGEKTRETERKFQIETFLDKKGDTHLVRAEFAAFTPGGAKCLFVRDMTSFWIADVATCKRGDYVPSPLTSPVRSATLAPDGKTLALVAPAEKEAEEKGGIVLGDASTGAANRRLTAAEARSDDWATFAPDGKTLVTLSEKSVHVWDLMTGDARSIDRNGRGPAAISPDGKLLAFEDKSALRIWNIGKGEEVRRCEPHRAHVAALAFSPDGKRLASIQEHEIQIWDTATGKALHAFPGHLGEVISVAFSPDGETLASGDEGDEAVLQLWNLATRRPQRRLSGHRRNVLCVAFAPDGKSLATGDGQWGLRDGEGSLRFWDAATGELLRRVKAHPSGVYCLAYSPDGKQLASSGGDKITTVWNPETGEKEKNLRGVQDQINSVAFAPDGKTLATAGNSSALTLWDVGTGNSIADLKSVCDCFTSVEYRLGGKILVTGERETFRRWDVGTRTELGRIQKERKQARCQAVSPDGLTLATGGEDRIVYLWDLGRGKQLLAFRGHRGEIKCLAFSPDGSWLASGSEDTTVLLWDLRRLPRTRPQMLFTDLMDSNEEEAAYAAMTLETMPASVLPLLKEALPKAAALEKQIVRNFADLDDADYAVREKASRELEKIGLSAEATLRFALRHELPPETARRIQEILDSLAEKESASAPPSEVLGAMRSLQILEHIDTHEARQLLEMVAKGHPDAPLTKEAKAALARLAKQ
jgi:WD40 repeat protein